MTDNDTMPFGAHFGKKMANVPDDYLKYIYSQKWINKWPNIKSYIEDNFPEVKVKKNKND